MPLDRMEPSETAKYLEKVVMLTAELEKVTKVVENNKGYSESFLTFDEVDFEFETGYHEPDLEGLATYFESSGSAEALYLDVIRDDDVYKVRERFEQEL